MTAIRRKNRDKKRNVSKKKKKRGTSNKIEFFFEWLLTSESKSVTDISDTVINVTIRLYEINE
jgi:hypothetical protein